MDSAPPHLPPPQQSQSLEMSLSARLLNIFAAPGEVFDFIKNKPHSVANWLLPATLFAVITIIGAAFVLSQENMSHQIEEMIDQQMAKSGVRGAQAEAGRSIGILSAKIGMVVGPVMGAFIMPFWAGLVIWLVGAKILKGNFDYMKAVEAGGLSNMISVLDALVKIPLVLVVGNIYATLSLGLFVKDFNPQNFTHSALAVVNIMYIWGLVVRSIAVARLSGRSFAVAAAWVFGIAIVLGGTCMGIGFGIQAAFRH